MLNDGASALLNEVKLFYIALKYITLINIKYKTIFVQVINSKQYLDKAFQ